MLAHIDVWLCIGVMLVALWTFLQYDLPDQPTPQDTTYHIYAAQQMLEGHAIYRDVAIIKAPLADFMTTFALVVGRLLHLRDTIAARILFMLVATLTIGVIYLTGRRLFQSRIVGIVATLIVAGNNFFGESAVSGPEPKTLIILFSFAALILIARRNWGWAGICSALAALAWQPGAMVMAITAGAAILAPWLDKSSPNWRTRANWLPFARSVGGMILPFAVLVAYLALNNALLPAWNATIGANVSHLNNRLEGAPLNEWMQYNAQQISRTMRTYCVAATEWWQLVVGGLGIFGIGLTALGAAIRSKRLPLNLERTPLLLYGIGFGIFTLIDFDFCPDLFPLLPVLAIGVGWMVWTVIRGAAQLVTHFSTPRAAKIVTLVSSLVVILVLTDVGVVDAMQYEIPGIQYRDQLNLARRAAAYLHPKNQILSLGNAVILVELHRDNASKIVHLGEKSARGVLQYEPGGMDAMIEALDQNPPKLISLARVTRQEWNADFLDWVQDNYHLVFDDKYNSVKLYLLNKKVTAD